MSAFDLSAPPAAGVLGNARVPACLVPVWLVPAVAGPADAQGLVGLDIALGGGIIARHEDPGIPVFDPHRDTLEEGGMKRTDAERPDLGAGRAYLFPGLLPGISRDAG